MTPELWKELMHWVGDRFPNKPWTAEQSVAYYHDLERFDPTDVWTALHALYEKGQAFAPNGSQLVAATLQIQRMNARPEWQTALPEPVVERFESAFAETRFGKKMTGLQLIERIHSDMPRRKCGNKDCGLHEEERNGRQNHDADVSR